MNNTGDLITINDINFQAHIEDDEARRSNQMIDLNKYRLREKAIRSMIGVKERDHTLFMGTEIFSVYFHPGNGRMTGIRDNERNQFYHYQQEDLIKFVGMVNVRQIYMSKFCQSIELEFKKHLDRNIEHYERIEELQEQLKPFINLAKDYNLTLDGLYNAFEELLEKNEINVKI